jgi:transcriptional regulator with XRE-family HTH domain
MTQEQVEFGRRLQKERDARGLSLAEIARVTKIPERVLDHLESGAWQALPAEVFVRGFLKSYCRIVGLDADETVRHYGELCRGGAQPVTLTAPAPSRAIASSSDGPLPAEPAPPPVKLVADPAPIPEEQSLLAALAEASRGSSRTSLTVAVIILVIVATLTLSLLLRRPSHVGDGVSAIPARQLGV